MKKLLVALFLLVPCLAVLAQTEVTLAPAQQKALNVFFSNFSETDVKSFTPATLNDATLLEFGLAHNLINRMKSLKRSADGYSVIITSEQVDSATEKYFGKRLTHHRSSTYQRPLADGEAYTFSQVKSLTNLGSNTYLANGAVYSGDTANPHGTPAQWQQAGDEVTQVGSFVAKIKSVGGRYILLEYKVIAK